jgi:hypothetical protein
MNAKIWYECQLVAKSMGINPNDEQRVMDLYDAHPEVSAQPLLTIDLEKGKSDRDGLIQQIVTYVRDGHTVTRKQWVRSTFADHAKKNEEEKKQTMLNEKEREARAQQKKLNDANEKAHNADVRAYKKEKTRQAEEEGKRGHTSRNKKLTVDNEYSKKLLEEAKKKKKEDKKGKEKQKGDSKKDKKKDGKHQEYGGASNTRANNRTEDRMMQQ